MVSIEAGFPLFFFYKWSEERKVDQKYRHKTFAKYDKKQGIVLKVKLLYDSVGRSVCP